MIWSVENGRLPYSFVCLLFCPDRNWPTILSHIGLIYQSYTRQSSQKLHFFLQMFVLHMEHVNDFIKMRWFVHRDWPFMEYSFCTMTPALRSAHVSMQDWQIRALVTLIQVKFIFTLNLMKDLTARSKHVAELGTDLVWMLASSHPACVSQHREHH